MVAVGGLLMLHCDQGCDHTGLFWQMRGKKLNIATVNAYTNGGVDLASSKPSRPCRLIYPSNGVQALSRPAATNEGHLRNQITLDQGANIVYSRTRSQAPKRIFMGKAFWAYLG